MVAMVYPSFYDPQRVGDLYMTRGQQVREEAMRHQQEYNIAPASDDQEKVKLLIIDAQVDFIHTEGALSVPGAVEDTRRIIEWIFENVHRITDIEYSLDSHQPLQIFDPAWWTQIIRDDNGNVTDLRMPDPMAVITPFDLGILTPEQEAKGVERVVNFMPRFYPDWSFLYVETLFKNAKKPLVLWPPHTQIGTVGHALMPALSEAITYWSVARVRNPQVSGKGDDPRSEQYSIFEKEVPVPGSATNMNNRFINDLTSYSKLFVAGQAKSHCVLESVNTLVRKFSGDVSRLLENTYIFMDAMSSVEGGIEEILDDGTKITHLFEDIANQQYDQFANQYGINLVSVHDDV